MTAKELLRLVEGLVEEGLEVAFEVGLGHGRGVRVRFGLVKEEQDYEVVRPEEPWQSS